MRDIQHIRRTSDAAPTIPSLLGLFNFDPIMAPPPKLGNTVPTGKAATLRLMECGKPTDDVMRQLTRLFGRNEFDASAAALKLCRPRQSIADVLRAGAKHGLLTTHVTKPLGTIYYRIAS